MQVFGCEVCKTSLLAVFLCLQKLRYLCGVMIQTMESFEDGRDEHMCLTWIFSSCSACLSVWYISLASSVQRAISFAIAMDMAD